MTIDLKFTTEIGRPVEVVCDAISDIKDMGRWFSVKEIRNISEGPVRVGTTFDLVADFLGADRVMQYQVTDFEPCRKFAYASNGAMPTQITMLLSPISSGTSLTLRFTAKAPRLVEPMIKQHLRRQTAEDLVRLATMLESQAGTG